MLRNTRIHRKLQILFQLCVPGDPSLIGTTFTVSCEFGTLQVKIWYHMFSSMKMEKSMESEPFWHFSSKIGLQKYSAVLGSRGSILCTWGLTDCNFVLSHLFWLSKVKNSNLWSCAYRLHVLPTKLSSRRWDMLDTMSVYRIKWSQSL